MRTDTLLLGPESNPDYHPEIMFLALSAQLEQMIAMARTLVASQRQIDVEGLQDLVGLICAKALDAPPNQSGFLKLELQRLVSALDALSASLKANVA